jgi:hypothetical protein
MNTTTTFSNPAFHAQANVESARKRVAIAEIRARLSGGQLSLAEVLADNPPALADLALFEVVRMARGMDRDTVHRLNRDAITASIADGTFINLACPMGRTSATTRRWVAEHAPACAKRTVCSAPEHVDFDAHAC